MNKLAKVGAVVSISVSLLAPAAYLVFLMTETNQRIRESKATFKRLGIPQTESELVSQKPLAVKAGKLWMQQNIAWRTKRFPLLNYGAANSHALPTSSQRLIAKKYTTEINALFEFEKHDEMRWPSLDTIAGVSGIGWADALVLQAQIDQLEGRTDLAMRRAKLIRRLAGLNLNAGNDMMRVEAQAMLNALRWLCDAASDRAAQAEEKEAWKKLRDVPAPTFNQKEWVWLNVVYMLERPHSHRYLNSTPNALDNVFGSLIKDRGMMWDLDLMVIVAETVADNEINRREHREFESRLRGSRAPDFFLQALGRDSARIDYFHLEATTK